MDVVASIFFSFLQHSQRSAARSCFTRKKDNKYFIIFHYYNKRLSCIWIAMCASQENAPSIDAPASGSESACCSLHSGGGALSRPPEVIQAATTGLMPACAARCTAGILWRHTAQTQSPYFVSCCHSEAFYQQFIYRLLKTLNFHLEVLYFTSALPGSSQSRTRELTAFALWKKKVSTMLSSTFQQTDTSQEITLAGWV